jgi:hypothetical protein
MAFNVFNAISTLPFLLSLDLVTTVSAQNCQAPTVNARYPAPVMAAGYQARLVVSGMHLPRSIEFDSQGNLLVLEQSIGVTVLQLNDAGGDCITVASKNTIVADYTVSCFRFKHGLELCIWNFY